MSGTGAGDRVRILGDGEEAMTLDRLREPSTGLPLAPVRPDGAAVTGLGEDRAGFVAAIVDTGLDRSHPWIDASLIESIDFTGEGEQDTNGHGTWVALLLLWWIPMPAGLLNVKALGSDGTGSVDALARGIRWAAQHGAGFINVSAGIHQAWCQGDCRLCQAALDAGAGGVPVAAAAGNIAGQTTCPAKAGLIHPGRGVLAVGAMDPATAQPQPYSGTGSAFLPSPAVTLRPVIAAGGSAFDPAAADALIQQAIACASMGAYPLAVQAFDQVVERGGSSSDPRLRARAASALVNKGFMYHQSGGREEEVGCYGEALARFGSDDAPEVAAEVADARVRRAQVLEREDPEGALSDYAAAIGDAAPPVGTPRWTLRARTLLNRGVLLKDMGRLPEALADFERLVADYGDLATGDVEVWLTRALVNLGTVLSGLGDDRAAAEHYSTVEASCGRSDVACRRWAAAAAAFNRGNCLRRLGDEDGARAAFVGVVDRYADDPATSDVVAAARASLDA